MLNILFAFLVTLSTQVCAETVSTANTTNTPDNKEVWITVCIHGTLGLQYTLGPYTMLRIMLDNIRGTLYKNTIELLRDNPIFYKSQAMQDLGLHRVQPHDAHNELGPKLFCHAYDAMQQKFNPRYTVYYTFGWSGLLSGYERRKAGYALYAELKDVYRKWSEAGYTPRISILGYSHGGTIAEYIAPCHAEDEKPTFSHVDELILLATPTQCIHESYAAWPIFRRVYDIYSTNDIFRILDFVSTPDPWPHRRMRNRVATNNIYRIRLRITMPPICNGQYDLYRKNRYRKPFDPGHIEMYFFGWSNTNWLYRNNFPISPLPAAIFVPLIVAYEEQFPGKDVVFDIWPPEEQVNLRAQHTCQWYRYAVSLSSSLDELRTYARERKPHLDLPLASGYSARKSREMVYTIWDDVYDKCPERERHRSKKSSFVNC